MTRALITLGMVGCVSCLLFIMAMGVAVVSGIVGR